jgi:hypothetical protein
MVLSRLIPAATVVAATVLVAFALGLSPGASAGDTTAERCDEVATSFAVLQSEITELDQSLYRSIELMRRVPQDEQLEAMQSVIEEMAAQRADIREKMKVAHQKLVLHLLSHMIEHPSGDDVGLADCPLMQHMSDAHREIQTGGHAR